jgi:hypothetical protein
MKNLTIVTGIWDLNRSQAGEGFKRPFSHYTDNFKRLLETDIPMLVYIEEEHEHIVWECREKENTQVRIKEVSDFKDKFDFYDQIQSIRTNPDWASLAGWLPDSTQATLEMYNPMVMSKMFMLNDAVLWNPFCTEYFAWLDGGITSTVHPGYFTHDKVLDKAVPYLEKFFFISFPYEGSSEIHGFPKPAINQYCETDDVGYVCRGGFFGGHIDYISEANGHYYGLLAQSLHEGNMGTEESIFTIMSHQKPEMYKRFMIQDNGLINYFFESIKNDEVIIEKTPVKVKKKMVDVDLNNIKTSLYVIGFNSPRQFQMLCDSYKTQSGFLEETNNFLLDNSTDLSTTDEYIKLCEEYNFTHIKKDNIGICGGRQFIAEHFDSGEDDFYIFLEDDMMLQPEKTSTCKNGFREYIPELYNSIIKIMIEEAFDFLKLSFSEFYGDNTTQWSWYNVPQKLRFKFWPENPKLPEQGLDPDAPKTKFNNIKCTNGVPYADGEIYYCNWPQIVSRSGNKKMFIDTTFANPFEQTWMSHIFQETRKGEINPGILLASPILHNREDHYGADLRREN